jgi:hypothetical protein
MGATDLYAAFDLETARVLPEAATDLMDYRPLGIACAAAVLTDRDEPVVWHGDCAGTPAAQMSRGEACALVEQLATWAENGYTLVTWNGLGFDFNVLAEESGLPEECARLALEHVDMMFHVVCRLGYPVSLGKAAEGLGLPGKRGGMTGHDAPILWAEGRHREVLDYNVHDARLALAIARETTRLGELVWITRRGTKGRMPLERGWRRVRDALEIPLPDTSWMSNPCSREEFTRWMPVGAVPQTV